MNKNEIIFTLEELPKVARELADRLKDCKILTFEGPLGAGKTTLIKQLLSLYGVNENVVSPTFTYMNIYYKANNGKTFYHFDLYRISKVEDFLAAGFDEYLIDPYGVCFIEWPEVIEPIIRLKTQVCRLTLDYHKDENTRVIRFELTPPQPTST